MESEKMLIILGQLYAVGWPACFLVFHLCKLACDSHIGLNQITVSRASTIGIELLLYQASLISFHNKVQKPLITHMHLSDLISQFFTFMQISLWQPYWIESRNYFMCINYRCCVVVVPSIIDLASKMAEKPSSTQMVVKLLTDDAADADAGRTDRREGWNSYVDVILNYSFEYQ